MIRQEGSELEKIVKEEKVFNDKEWDQEMFDSLTPDIQKKVNKYILHNEKKAIDIKDVMRSLHEDGEVIKGSRLGLS